MTLSTVSSRFQFLKSPFHLDETMPKSTIQHNLKPSLRPRPKWKAVPDGLGQVDSYGITTHGFSGPGLRKFVDNLFDLASTTDLEHRCRKLNALCASLEATRLDGNVTASYWSVPSKQSSATLSFYTRSDASVEDIVSFLSREYPGFDTSRLQRKPCLTEEPKTIPL